MFISLCYPRNLQNKTKQKIDRTSVEKKKEQMKNKLAGEPSASIVLDSMCVVGNG